MKSTLSPQAEITKYGFAHFPPPLVNLMMIFHTSPHPRQVTTISYAYDAIKITLCKLMSWVVIINIIYKKMCTVFPKCKLTTSFIFNTCIFQWCLAILVFSWQTFRSWHCFLFYITTLWCLCEESENSVSYKWP